MDNRKNLYNLQQIINRNTQRIIRPRNAACSLLVDKEIIEDNCRIILNQNYKRERCSSQQLYDLPKLTQKLSLPQTKLRIHTLDERAMLQSDRIIQQCSDAINEVIPHYYIKFKPKPNRDIQSILRAEKMHQYIKQLIFQSVEADYEIKNKKAENYVRNFTINLNKNRMINQYKKKQLKEMIQKHKQSTNREERYLKTYTLPD